MAYGVIGDSEIETEKRVTQSLMQRLRDNLEGAFAGEAPFQANQAAVGPGAVGQAQIKTATASSAITFNAGNSSLALVGGTYSMYTFSASSNVHFGAGNSAAGVLGFYTAAILPSTASVYIDERYFQASPPYCLGDGEVPLFVYVLVNSQGEVVGYSEAPDPVWLNHGPTCCTPDFYENVGGKLVGVQRKYRYPAGINTPRKMARYRRENPDKCRVVAVDKHADMDVVPHPFFTAPSDLTPVLLDPVSDIVLDLRDAHDAGEDMSELIMERVVVDNVPLRRGGPRDIDIVGARFL